MIDVFEVIKKHGGKFVDFGKHLFIISCGNSEIRISMLQEIETGEFVYYIADNEMFIQNIAIYYHNFELVCENTDTSELITIK